MKKLGLVLGGILLVATLIHFLKERESATRLREQNHLLRQQLEQVTAEYERLATGKSESAATSQEFPPDQLKELLRLRNEVSMLRKQTNAPALMERARISNDLSLSYDPTLWKPLSAVHGSEYESATWDLQQEGWIQVTAAKHAGQKTEAEYKHQILETQKMRGDPAELAAERHEAIGGNDWLVLEMRNLNTQPHRREINYFLPLSEGYATLFVIGEEASVIVRRQTIEGFLNQVRVN